MLFLCIFTGLLLQIDIMADSLGNIATHTVSSGRKDWFVMLNVIHFCMKQYIPSIRANYDLNPLHYRSNVTLHASIRLVLMNPAFFGPFALMGFCVRN